MRQNGNTRDMIFSVPDLLAYVSSIMTLEAGDVLLTGTSALATATRSPRRHAQGRRRAAARPVGACRAPAAGRVQGAFRAPAARPGAPRQFPVQRIRIRSVRSLGRRLLCRFRRRSWYGAIPPLQGCDPIGKLLPLPLHFRKLPPMLIELGLRHNRRH